MEDLSSEQSHILNAIAHELKNPLIIINGHADLATPSDPETKKHVDSIKNVVNRLLRTIDTLLLSSKLEAEQTDFESSLFDVRGQVRSVTQELEGQLAGRHQHIVFRSPRKLPSVYGNPTYTHLALYNLIENASNHSPNKTNISVSIRVFPNSLKILVRDQGIGVRKADIDRLFTQFGRLKAPLHQRPANTGLGLYIAKRLAESMRGGLDYLGVREGGCFVLTLPTTEQLKLFS